MREHVSRASKRDRRARLSPGLIGAVWTAMAVALVTGACERTPDPEALERAPSGPAAAASTSSQPQIVCLGDSLTAGLGLEPEQAYPALLQQRVQAAGYPYDVVNAGVSGDTSAGGLRRLKWSLGGDARVLIVALGANDGLRGLAVEELRRNLSAILEEARSRDIAVLLAGMEAPPNFGPSYTRSFRDVYSGLARTYEVAFVPFLLEGVAGVTRLNQADGIHPTAEGQRALADLLWPELERVLKGLDSR
jgi:acyl-CoA thioesterase-1